MTLRHHALGHPNALGLAPFLAVMAALFFAFLSLSPPGAASSLAPETAQSGPDGKLVTRTNPPQNLPDRRVYDKVSIQVFGAMPPTRNGKTGQIDMFVLGLIFLSAVTLLMWRHYRRDDASPRRIGRRI